MTDNTARFVGDIPIHYDRGLGPVFFEHYATDIARRAAACAPRDVLETAAGTGVVTRRLRDLLAREARLTATDLNEPMLEVARAKFGADEPVVFQAADAGALPFADGAFDAVVCQFGLMFFPDKDAAHREAHRTLRPRGRYLFSVWDSLRHNPIPRVAMAVLAQFFPADPPQVLEAPFSAFEIDPIKESLIGAGFRGIVVSVSPSAPEVPDASPFARGLVFGSPLIDQIRARAGADPERIVDALARRLEAEFGAGPTRFPMQAIVFEAEKP